MVRGFRNREEFTTAILFHCQGLDLYPHESQQNDLLILLFSFQFSFFLWTTLGFFLLFPFAFIFTSLITHICFSVIENECSSQLRQTGLTFSALGPFGPRPSVYDTRCPSWRFS